MEFGRRYSTLECSDTASETKFGSSPNEHFKHIHAVYIRWFKTASVSFLFLVHQLIPSNYECRLKTLSLSNGKKNITTFNDFNFYLWSVVSWFERL